MSKNPLERSSTEKERPLVTYKESYEIAEQISARYQDKLTEAVGSPPVDEQVSPFKRDAISHFLKSIPAATRERFYGHGITKTRGKTLDTLAALINVLQNQQMQGYSGPLARESSDGFMTAYTSGPFLLVSHCDKLLIVPNKQPRETDVGWTIAVDIGAFVVNNDYYPIVDELKSMFPKANIIRANELPGFIEKETTEKIGQSTSG